MSSVPCGISDFLALAVILAASTYTRQRPGARQKSPAGDSLTYGELFGALERVTRSMGRKVNPTVYTGAEFSNARTENAFLARVLEQQKLWVIGSEDDLPVAPWPLERLAGPGNVLAKEPPDAKEFAGLERSGLVRLRDAENGANSLESRFDLAYSAAHALCLAALRHRGFRPSNRYIGFQVLPDTPGLRPEVWRVLAKCRDLRNRTEYEGVLDVDERLLSDPIGVCRKVAEKVRALPAIQDKST